MRTIVNKRFGEKRVSYDPSDLEANALAFSKGYTVVTGSQASADEWNNFRRACAVIPAGQVTPSPKPYSKTGPMEELLSRQDWTDSMIRTETYAKMLAKELMGFDILIRFTMAGCNFMACYGEKELTFNLNGGCQEKWFENVGSVEMDDLLIHEFGHEYCSNHLNEDYYNALTKLGAKLKRLALERPELFQNLSTGRDFDSIKYKNEK